MDGAPPPADQIVLSEEDRRELDALLAGDEQAFASLVDRYSRSLLRVALTFVPTRSAAEEVVQETWLAVLQGLDRFEGRSSLRTWIFRILMNTARRRGERERRSVPFATLAGDEESGPTVDPGRFDAEGYWSVPPASVEDVPEDRVLSSETLEHVRAAIGELPPLQRQVITLRDVDGFSSREVCNVLGITETNQRVLLHRARARVRRSLAAYLDPTSPEGESSP